MKISARLWAVIVVLVLPCLSLYGTDKQVNGLVFTLEEPAAQGYCTSPFMLRQEPDPYFTGVHIKKVDGKLRFLRKKDVLENFPGEVVLQFWVSSPMPDINACQVALQSFDGAQVKFKAVWMEGTHRVPAKGIVVPTEGSAASQWCEDHCSQLWSYELRIDSADIPLTDKLEIIVQATTGNELVRFLGHLGSDGIQNFFESAVAKY